MADTKVVFDIIAKDRASATMQKVRGASIILGAAIGVMAIKFGKDSVSAFVAAQTAQDRLSYAFKQFPTLADTNIGRLRALNTSLAQKTKFDDDATASGQAVLAQFKLTGKQIESLTPLLQDYAAKTGQDLPTAAGLLGKAFLGNARALKLVGINFKATGDTAKDFTTIQGLLSAKVGGFATGEGKTAAGQAAILHNQFGELEESVGSKLVPALVKLAGVLLSVIGFMQRNGKVVSIVATVLGTLVGVIWAVNAGARAYAATQAALNVVMTANPIGLVVVALALLVVGLIVAYKHSEKFRAVVQFALGAIGTYFKTLWAVVRPVLGFIIGMWFTLVGALIHGAAAAFGWVPGLGPKLKAAAKAFDTFRDGVNRALAGIHDKTVHVNVITSGVGLYGNKPRPDAKAAEGGLFKARPGGWIVQLAEAGHDEMVVPMSGPNAPRGATSAGARSGGGGDTYVLNVASLDPKESGRLVMQALLAFQRQRGGSLPELVTR